MEEKDVNVGRTLAIIAVLFGIVLIIAMIVKGFGGQANNSDVSTKNVYDDHGLSFTYPGNYVISSDEEEEGLLDVLCEIKGSDISQIEISAVGIPEMEYSQEDIAEICEASLEGIRDHFRNMAIYRNVVVGDIKKGTLGKNPCYQRDIRISILSVTSNGVAKVAVTDTGKLLVVVEVAENDQYMKTLQAIEQSIKIQ